MESPNNYTVIVFDLHPKVKSFIDQLAKDGQIDRGTDGYPYVISSSRDGDNIVTTISRNKKQESFVLRPRSRRDPIMSWDPEDGFVSVPEEKTIQISEPTSKDGRLSQERAKRVPESVIKNMVRQIFED